MRDIVCDLLSKVLHSPSCIAILLALFGCAVTTDAHICIPGIFWQAPRVATTTENNQPSDLQLPESFTTDTDVPPILVSPAGDRLRGANEQHPADAMIGSSSASTPTIVPVVIEPNTFNPQKGRTEKGSPESDRFHWWTAVKESLLYTGIMHTFDLTTEAGTRDALNGHWFRNYTRSLSELRGWSDSDRFMAPYAGHPIEGSVFGFIQRQNDPRYRLVQWGDGRDYWVSMLRSMAFSAVWHTQWKIGPASEASIGNVMLHASPGFITLVDTPTLGFCTMLAEDAADRYLIIGLENRSTNRALIILARSFLNPGRTMQNLMAFHVPWQRNTRIGLFGANYELRKELVQEFKEEGGEKPFEFVRDAYKPVGVEFKHDYPREAPIELTAFPEYESFLGGGSCVGGGGTGAARVNPELQVVAEVNGCLIMHQPTYNMSADSLSYSGGLRWTPLASHRYSPFVQLKFGGRKVTTEIDDIELKKKLLDEWNNGGGDLHHYPVRSDWSAEAAVNGPMVSVGGGLDVVLSRPFAWRALNIEYSHSWINNIGGIHPQNGILIATEAVVRIGTW